MAEIPKEKLQIPELPPTSVDADSFLSDISRGAIPKDELRFRLNASDGIARPSATSPDAAFRGRDGQLRVTGFNRANRASFLQEPRSGLTGEQREVITRVAENAEQRSIKARTAGAGDLAVTIVENRLSSSDITNAILQKGFESNVASEINVLANLRGDIENQDINALVVDMFRTGDDSALTAVLKQERDKYADISDEGAIQASVGQLQEYLQTARRVNLRTKFWKQTQDPNAELGQLERYEEIDLNDTELVRELRSNALELRRDRLFSNAYGVIAQEQPDYQSAAILLSAAATVVDNLKDSDGLQTLAIVANDVYQAEINATFGALTKSLGIDKEKIAGALAELEDAPIRPAIAGVEYFDKFAQAKQDFLNLTDSLTRISIDKDVVELRKRFINDGNIQGIIEGVLELPAEVEEDVALRQSLLDELAFNVTATRGLNPARFALLKDVEVQGIRSRRGTTVEQLDLSRTDPERNAEAVGNVVRRFQSNIMPLFEALRGGESGGVLVNKYVSGRGNGNRSAYVQRVDSLSEQRGITDIERAYLESVQLLTVFNPHLVALMREEPELTSLYLEKHFSALDNQTKEGLAPDAFVPVLQIGLGPNGLASAGELNRANPLAAEQTLYIDAADYPGGPFGVAKGQAWELNSANSISPTTNILPDLSSLDESGASVRSYGSPLVSYPGERRQGSDVRQGSINVTVDYLPNPDNVSSKRYPTNVDLARVLQLQAAMLIDNAMLSTKVTNVSPIDDGQPGNKRVTLEYQTADGESIVSTVRTDSIIIAGGLGEPNFGINLAGSNAEKILAEDIELADRFPQLTDTIGAFSALSSPEGEPVAPRDRLRFTAAGIRQMS